jgi:hypothetical protein
MDPLTTSLLDFLHELEGRGIPITVGGGFGLYLKRQHLVAEGQRLLFDRLPEPRSTNDIDLFLRTEVLVDLERTRAVADAIRRLGYSAVEDAKYFQWKREFAIAGVLKEVKIDFLVGPLGQSRENLRTNKMPRVRPRGGVKFHARATEEAVRIEDGPLAVTVTGTRSTGEAHTAVVYAPQAFPYLMMKLHAFDDREDNGELDKARHHALDLYTIVGIMTEEEYERAKELGVIHASDEHVLRARAIVGDRFSARTAVGTLRIQEHQLFRDAFLLDEFMSVLAEIFPRG